MISFTAEKICRALIILWKCCTPVTKKFFAQCGTLRKLSLHLTNNGCDLQVQQAAQNILRYFDTAGEFHHQDEEKDLFPAMRISADADKSHLGNLLERLLQEHIEMREAWDSLRPVLLQLSQGMQVPLARPLQENFINRYTEHIAFEESELLPLATRLLDAQQLLEIGKRMAERRGANVI